MTGEVASRFDDAVRRLDAELAALLSGERFQACEVRDHSNLTGFEKSGFPFYLWSKELIMDRSREGEVWRTSIGITYVEPVDADDPRIVTVESRGEVFHPGSLSRIDRRSKTSVPLADVGNGRLREVLERAWTEAEALLYGERRG